MSNFLEPIDPIRIIKRDGSNENPYVSIEEVKQVTSCKVILTEIPDKFTKVTVKDGNGVNLKETTSLLLNTDQYYVDYLNGIVYFHSSNEGKYFKFTYKGTGVIQISASRVFLSDNSNPEETLSNLAKNVRDNSDYVKRIADQADQAVQTANNVQEQLNQIVIEGDSSVEAAQARVDAEGNVFTTLKERLDTKETQFANEIGILNKSKFEVLNFVEQFGGKGDGITDNVQAFVNMAAYVNSKGGNCTIFFPPGTYVYKPTFTTNNEWRSKVELVDVKNVTIIGYGATIKQIKDGTWTAGDALGNQESPIQFRSSVSNGCQNIKIYGLTIQGDRVPYDSITGDGSCNGITFRGVKNILIKDVMITGWGTDGLYVGTMYGNGDKSSNLKVEGCDFDNNTRQAISIAGCDDVVISNSSFSNTNGGSFGHGIDFEPVATMTQRKAVVTNCIFTNNQRGAFNFIRTSDVVVSNCVINEEHALCNGAIFADANADSITFDNCRIVTNKAVLYILGNNITNFEIKNSKIKTTTLPNDNATIRINPNGTQTNLQNIAIRNCDFEGTGGFNVKMDGDFFFEDNRMSVSKQNSTSADCFALSSSGTGKNYIRRNKIKINTDVVFQAEKDCYIVNGVFEGNELESHANAVMSIQDRGAGRTIQIGHNVFSDYFYYKGEVSQLNVKVEGTIVEKLSGEYGLATRLVHGGRFRVTMGTNAQVGDVTRNSANMTGANLVVTEYTCIAAGSPGTWVATKWYVKKGPTSQRPSLASYDAGVMYLDTTLDPDGKPIWWNGSAWVDSTGTVV